MRSLNIYLVIYITSKLLSLLVKFLKQMNGFSTTEIFSYKNISKRKTVDRGASSYHYKHIVENHIHHYVANGMLIAAAIACGYDMRYNNYCGPNAFFAWSTKDWNPFEYRNNPGHSGPPLDEEWTEAKSKRLKELLNYDSIPHKLDTYKI